MNNNMLNTKIGDIRFGNIIPQYLVDETIKEKYGLSYIPFYLKCDKNVKTFDYTMFYLDDDLNKMELCKQIANHEWGVHWGTDRQSYYIKLYIGEYPLLYTITTIFLHADGTVYWHNINGFVNIGQFGDSSSDMEIEI